MNSQGHNSKRNKVIKYTLVDLVDNINTDVKSEVADFDFEASSKAQVVAYFERKVAQIREEHSLQIRELKEESQRTQLELNHQLQK